MTDFSQCVTQFTKEQLRTIELVLRESIETYGGRMNEHGRQRDNAESLSDARRHSDLLEWCYTERELMKEALDRLLTILSF